VDTHWVTVDRLIHDLGAIRAFVDEAEAVPGASHAPQVDDVRSALEQATDAITRLFTDSHDVAPDVAVEAAWTAIAHAQDAVLKARCVIGQAREGYERATTMRERNLEQFGRARMQSRVVSEQAHRAGLQRPGGVRPPVPAPRGPHSRKD
jgi:hypothetical protein